MIRFAAGPLAGEIVVAADKSITHRALILGGTVPGVTIRVARPNRGADVLATRDAVVALGATVVDDGNDFLVTGATPRDPVAPIDARNSGTTTRLLVGRCAGAGVTATFDGDASLRRRPMERVARPLRALGAVVETTDGRLPLTVRGLATPPAAGHATLELPSAQLKSALLLAYLDASGPLTLDGDADSRDHTERMLRHFGRDVRGDGRTLVLAPGPTRPRDVVVPRDLSAAAFFLVAALVTPGSEIVVTDVGLNPTRTGVLDVLAAMGASIATERVREESGEPVGDLRVRATSLVATELAGDLVVRAIDEIPILAVAAAFARGTTRIRDAADLRTKESDRLAVVAETLRACGIAVTEHPDGLDVTGGDVRLPDAPLPVHDDHRIAMAVAVLAAGANGGAIEATDAIAVSFPDFVTCLAGAQEAARGRAAPPP